MATESYTIKTIIRPYFDDLQSSDITAFDSTFHEIGQEQVVVKRLADYLIVGFDPYGNGSLIYRTLRFCDYDGLRDEWEDGTSVTTLTGALGGKMGEVKAQVVDAGGSEESPDKPTSYQRSSLINTRVSFEYEE